MSTIQKEVYDAFLAAGVPEEKADAAARALSQNPREMATKTDIAELTWRMVTGLIAVITINLATVGVTTAYLVTALGGQ